MPVFAPATPQSGLDVLAAAATATASRPNASLIDTTRPPAGAGPGPYNPAASLPPKVVKRILNLEFVEISDLRADIWVEEPPPVESARRPTTKPLVTDIKVWLECFGRMAAILTTRFPEKGPEFWAYQSTILRAAHNYEGGSWVAYDRQYRRDMLARKDLNWSMTNARLYNEAFTGRAKAIPWCPHCLGEDNAAAHCLHNPHPPVLGWIPDPRQFQPQLPQQI